MNGYKINAFRNYGKKVVAYENSEEQLECCYDNEDIETIVTKQQMKAMEYKVEEF